MCRGFAPRRRRTVRHGGADGEDGRVVVRELLAVYPAAAKYTCEDSIGSWRAIVQAARYGASAGVAAAVAEATRRELRSKNSPYRVSSISPGLVVSDFYAAKNGKAASDLVYAAADALEAAEGRAAAPPRARALARRRRELVAYALVTRPLLGLVVKEVLAARVAANRAMSKPAENAPVGPATAVPDETI